MFIFKYGFVLAPLMILLIVYKDIWNFLQTPLGKYALPTSNFRSLRRLCISSYLNAYLDQKSINNFDDNFRNVSPYLPVNRVSPGGSGAC